MTAPSAPEESARDALLSALPDLILLVGADGVVRACHVPADWALPCPADQVVGREIGDLLPPDAAAPARQRLREALETGESRPLAFEREGGGRSRSYEAWMVRHAPDAVLCTVRETAPRTATEARRAAEERLDRVLATSPTVLYTLDVADGEISPSWISENLTHLFGYSRAEALGPGWWPGHVHPDDRARAFAEMEELFERGHLAHQYRFRHADGDYRVVDDHLVLLRGRDGAPDEVVGSWTDVTDRWASERALEESEERFRQLADNIDAVFWLYDYAAGRTIYASPGYERIWGRRPEELYENRRAWAEALHPEDRERALAVMRAHRGEGYEVEYRIVRPDGRVVWIRDRAFPVRSRAGEVVRTAGIAEDVTEVRRAEAAHRESEARYRELVELSPEAIVVHQDGRLVFVNPAGVQLVRAEGPGELLGRPILDFVHPDDRAAAGERIRAVMWGEAPSDSLSMRVRRMDGTLAAVESRSTRIVYDGRPAAQVVLRDVTERLQAEHALRASEEQFRATFEQSAVGMSHVAPDGRFLRVNERLCEIVGRSRDELMATTFQAITHPDDVREDAALAARLFAGEIPSYVVEKRYVHRDGHPVWVRVTASVMRDPRGEISYAACVVEDVGGRRATEEAHRRSEERFRALVEHASDMVSILDAEGVIRYDSPAVRRVLGHPPEERVGRSALEFVHPDDVAALRGKLASAFEQPGRPLSFTVRARRRDGGWRVLEGTGVNLLHDPAVEGLVANFHDVTDARHAERQLRQAQRMEAVGRLAGGIAHDFNNLLTIIRGSTDFLLEDLPPDHPSRADAEEIRDGAERASALTRQLLTFSRQQVAQMEELDLNEVVRGVERMLRRTLGEDVELVTRLDPELGPIRADPGQIEQVLMNLAVNARDAMPRGGKLIMETTDLDLRDGPEVEGPASVRPGRYVVLAVSDTGEGIPAEVREHVFEPFFTTKPQGKGTGLGLATVYGIVKQSEGYVWVYSEEGMGTTFRIYLPRVEEAGARAPRPAAAPRPAGRGETVLLVEDEAAVRSIAKRVLERSGYRVLEAPSGAEALRLLGAHRGAIDLLLTDVVMPKMSGRELAERAQELRPGLKVVFTSGYTDETIAQHGVLEAGTRFLQKPYSPGVLARTVAEALDSGANGE